MKTPKDFTAKERFKWVESYPMISRVPNPYEATPEQITEGFQLVLNSKHIGPVLQNYYVCDPNEGCNHIVGYHESPEGALLCNSCGALYRQGANNGRTEVS